MPTDLPVINLNNEIRGILTGQLWKSSMQPLVYLTKTSSISNRRNYSSRLIINIKYNLYYLILILVWIDQFLLTNLLFFTFFWLEFMQPYGRLPQSAFWFLTSLLYYLSSLIVLLRGFLNIYWICAAKLKILFSNHFLNLYLNSLLFCYFIVRGLIIWKSMDRLDQSERLY